MIERTPSPRSPWSHGPPRRRATGLVPPWAWLWPVALIVAGCTRPAPAGDAIPATRDAATAAGSHASFPSPLAGTPRVGTDRCVPCHAAVAGEWRGSRHATTVRPADLEDEDLVNSLPQCSGSLFTHTMGHRHHLRFLVEDEGVPWGQGRFLALPCGYDVHERSLSLHHLEDWRQLPWESSCAPCHVTGFDAADSSFDELGVGCEACHGPGARHVEAPSRDNILAFGGRSAVEEVTVCASCHLQDGVSTRTGRKFPDGYVPGGSLFDDFTFDFDAMTAEARERALDAHQKILVDRVVNHGETDLRCTSCHAFHGLGHEKHRELPAQDHCHGCHEADMKLKEYSKSCNVCEF